MAQWYSNDKDCRLEPALFYFDFDCRYVAEYSYNCRKTMTHGVFPKGYILQYTTDRKKIVGNYIIR